MESLTYSELLKERDSAFYLRILISNFLRITVADARKIAESLKDLSNDKVLNLLKERHNNYIKKEKSSKSINNNIKANLNKILSELNLLNSNNINTYLDFGCNDGIKCNIISDILNIDHNNKYGLDVINNNFHQADDLISQNSFYQYDGCNIPDVVLSKSFDLITCFQVLHHIDTENINNILKKLIGTISPNGYFLLKEHDFFSEWMKSLIDLQHELFTIDKNMEYPILTYNSQKEWIDIFEGLGMKLIKIYIENPTCKMSFCALFQKV